MSDQADPIDAPSGDSVDETIGDPYCFESDHVALRGNPDYHKLLRTLCILEAQRSQALKDLDILHEEEKKALQDPIGFVDKLRRGVDLKLPRPQKIAPLPIIDWEKYTSSVDFATFGTHRRSARLERQENETTEDKNLQRLKSSLVDGIDNNPGDGSVAEGFVRGRFKDESKSSTFNKLWSPEEQKRLDELLIRFPPEKVEARRWRKIAAAFGDRTPQQIASRVQKYFEKLERAKLPIPGRAPNRIRHFRKVSHQHQRHNRMLLRDSTFLQSYKPPVLMKEEEDDGFSNEGPSASSRECSIMDSHMYTNTGSDERFSSQDNSDDESIPEHLRDTPEFKLMMQLKERRKELVRNLDPSIPKHVGFKCDRCGGEPIIGTRWHCVDCPSSLSVDFCETCADNVDSYETASHNSSHRIRPVKRTWNRSMQDQDYMSFNNVPGDYNYLDPNYMPAV